MHTVLFLSSMLTAMLAGRMLVGLADRAVDWRPRRTLQFLALAVPVLGLSFNLLGLHHFTVGSCFLGMPPWDYVLGAGLPVITAVVTVAALTAAFVRLLLLRRFVAGQGLPAGPLLQARVSRLAADLNAPIPEVRVCPLDRPLALSWGFRRPGILLSTWMLQHLDEHELEAVLAHELSHAARRDSLVVWLATVLRDSFFYLPASQSAYRQLQDDKELACDELAVGVTRRPMALASTLVKVWQKTAVPTPAMAQSLHGEAGLLQNRIARLLAPAPPSNLQRQQSSPLVIGLSALAVALVVEALITMTILAPMACGPFSPLGFVH